MKTERRAVHLPHRKTSSGCLVDAASASDTLQPNTEHACVQRARRGIHLGRRDGAAFLNIQDIGCSELIERMLERWVPVHSLERQATRRDAPPERPSRLGYFLGFGASVCPFWQCLPTRFCPHDARFPNTPRKEFLTLQKNCHFAHTWAKVLWAK
jgi:hypothetical protein